MKESHASHVNFGACCHCSLHNLDLNLHRDLLARNFPNQSHHSFFIISFVILVWTTDLTSFRLVQTLRSHYCFGTWVPMPFLLWPALLLPALGLSHVQFYYSTTDCCFLYVWCLFSSSTPLAPSASWGCHSLPM